MGHLNDARGTIMAIDTAPNGKIMAWGNHLGQVIISHFDLNNDQDEPDIRTVQGRVKAS